MIEHTEFLNGKEAAALASQDIKPYFIGEQAAMCYGASLGGGRVFNLGTMPEILAEQSNTRIPIVQNLVTSGKHLDTALNSGWIILLARNPQAVYDLNLAAVKIGEHTDIRLPVIVCYDEYFTHEQKHRLHVFDEGIQSFLGEPKAAITALDPNNPVTFGSKTFNTNKQHFMAMATARGVIFEVLNEFEKLTGRAYPILDAYRMDDAEYAVILLNTAAETAKDVVDQYRDKGLKVGVISPNVIRPFPIEDFITTLKNVKTIVVGDRAEGGNISLEIRAALQQDPNNKTVVLSRIYGKEFNEADVEAFFELAQNSRDAIPFDYYGCYKGEADYKPPKGLPVIDAKVASMATITGKSGNLKVELAPLWAISDITNRIAPGHGACPGCGIFSMLRQIFSVLEGELVILFQSGCGMVVTTDYPKTAHRITYIQNDSQNGATTLSGLVEMYHEKVRRGELAESNDITFLMITGDGGMDFGMGDAIGAANRNHRMIIIEYDNQGCMNTGGQLSDSTPLGHSTGTVEKSFHHKDTAQIFAACHLPYVFTASEGFSEDLMRKVAKAQWYAKREGLVYGKIMSFCPLHWHTPDSVAQSVMQAALDCHFFPLYEVEKGKTTLTYDPDILGTRLPVTSWLKRMGKTKHLLNPKNAAILKSFETEVERRWKRIKAMHEHEEL